MRMIRQASRWMPILALATAIGCSSRDERLAQFAEQSAERQKEQNMAMARQNEAVIRGSDRLTDAAQKLVEKDAAARQESYRTPCRNWDMNRLSVVPSNRFLGFEQ